MGGEKRFLPDLFIIGAMKCGTSSLHLYLDLHPEISMSKPKEPNFFVPELRAQLDINWYQSLFADKARLGGEASTAYTQYPKYKGVPQRMHSLLPDAKLIYIVRDPVDRIISHYVHEYARGRANGSLEEELRKNRDYVDFSRYFMQLAQYLEYYRDSQILIVTMEDLRERRQLVLRNIFRFLEVDESFYCPEFSRVLFRSVDRVRRHPFRVLLSNVPGANTAKQLLPTYLTRVFDAFTLSRVEKPTLTEELKEQLIIHLKADIDCLRDCTKNEFADWCV